MSREEEIRQASRRYLLEFLVAVIILVCGLSVLTVGRSSQASLTYDGGTVTYTGKVRNNRMNGQGVLTFDNGDQYDGQFKNGVFNGQGTFTSHSGWRYEGGFKNGQADGQGKLTAKDGKVYEGKFKQGIYQK